jgi:tetratricopeptide (TPR) repeat protein
MNLTLREKLGRFKLGTRIVAACPRRALPLVLKIVDPKWRRDRLPLDVFLQIRLHDRNAFIVCYCATRRPSVVSICPDHLEIDRFVDELSAWAASSFARGLQLALLDKTCDAAIELYNWTFDRSDIVNAHVFEPRDPPFSGFYGYPIFEFGNEGPTIPEGKIDLLIKIFHAYEKSPGNDSSRYRILEALDYALGYGLSALGHYDRAIECFKRVSRDRHFITLLCHTGRGPVLMMACPTQNEVEEFSKQLAGLATSAFARGLQHAITGEAYDAAFELFDWIFDAADSTVNAHFFDGADPTHPGYYGCPIFEFGRGGPRAAQDKIDLLAKIFDSCANADANHRTRYAILEALGFALSRSMGALGQFDRAIGYVERVLPLLPRSIHLSACRHALELRSRGAPVSPRLQKFCGRDARALDLAVCTHPFTRLEITPDGFAHVCCASLVPTAIGNIESENAAEIISSEMARKMRRSVLDGSYKYCNHLTCPLMIREQLPSKSDARILQDAVLGPAVSTQDDTVAEIRDLAFGYDWSCNLSCPSCRRETIVDHQKQSSERSHHIQRHVAPLLPKLQSLYINNSGEFLFSRPSRELLQSIDPAQHPNLKIDLISNGTLFSEREWQKFSNIHGLVRSIRISIDAATKETFELLRRGGRWENLIENLRFIGVMLRRGEIDVFMSAFTYQLRNFREMPAFVSFAEEMGANRVSFERLAPSASMTYEEFVANAVHLPTHPLHAQFLDILKDQAMSSSTVASEFEYPFAAALHSVAGKDYGLAGD